MPDEARVRAHVAELTAGMVPQARPEAFRVWQKAPHALELDELESLALSGLAAAGARWWTYCAEHGHSPEAYEFFTAYSLRRMRGSMLDYLRSQDWVTRTIRTKAKQIRDAGQDRPLSDAELAKAAGLTIAEVRETLAAVTARPVSMDADLIDIAAEDNVESQAVVAEVLAAATGVIARLGERERLLLILRYHQGLALAELAPYIGVEVDEAVRIHRDSVLAVHASMMKAVA